MHTSQLPLDQFIKQNLENQDPRLLGVILSISSAITEISRLIGKGNLENILGDRNITNCQGENQKKLDVISNDIFINKLKSCKDVAGYASEEDEVEQFFDDNLSAPFLVAFDPLDGSSNIDVNVSVGSIFSVLNNAQASPKSGANFLQKGIQQIAAGYAIYGPATMLVLTLGKGSFGFTFDRELNNFYLTHPNLTVPSDTSEYSINSSNSRFWEPPIQRYVSECKAGKTDIRGKDFNMRWVASMVAEIHRILMRGGVFMYPKDSKDPSKPGRLRLLYEANPMSFLIEQAGGFSSTGRKRILQIDPESIHQRIPVILGSRNEIELIENYFHAYDKGEDQFSSFPLFGKRSLFR